jgi:hypothetical protein
MNSRERFLATMNYQPRDRVPWGEMGFWPETLEVWYEQGMPEDVHLADYFGFDRLREKVGISLDLVPGFKPETLEETDEYRIVRRSTGVVAKEFKGPHSFRMPQWLSFPLHTRADWENEFLPRLNPGSPTRYPLYWAEKVRTWAQRDDPLTVRGGSIFGWLRNWMGLEAICLAFYDDPAWVQEMMDYLAGFCCAAIRRTLEDVELDYVLLWEPLLPLWIEGGVNGFYPIERAASMDAAHLRQRFGRELRLLGGIDKRAMIAGPAEIDAELARVAPLAAEGGYIPWCDHHVPPDVPLAHYRYYVERMKEMTLDPVGFRPNL